MSNLFGYYGASGITLMTLTCAMCYTDGLYFIPPIMKLKYLLQMLPIFLHCG